MIKGPALLCKSGSLPNNIFLRSAIKAIPLYTILYRYLAHKYCIGVFSIITVTQSYKLLLNINCCSDLINLI